MLIPVNITELEFPRALTAATRARLVSGSGRRMVWRRLVQRRVVLMMRRAMLLAATETLRHIIVSDCSCGSKIVLGEIGVGSGEVVRMKVVFYTIVICSVLQIVIQD